jgi:hypothetical protein
MKLYMFPLTFVESFSPFIHNDHGSLQRSVDVTSEQGNKCEIQCVSHMSACTFTFVKYSKQLSCIILRFSYYVHNMIRA